MLHKGVSHQYFMNTVVIKIKPRTVPQQFVVVLIWTSILYVGYQLTNRFHFFEPHYLPMFEFEYAIPFWTWTVLPYFLLIGGMYLPTFLSRPQDFAKALYAITFAVCINYTIFILYPTVFPRPPAPEGTSLFDVLYRWLIGIDTPANCFPSGHICVPAIGTWYLMKEHKRVAWLYGILFTFFALTVLTTKQHYAIDIVGGLMTACVGIVLAEKYIRFVLDKRASRG